MKTIDYVSRSVMDRYFDKYQRKLDRLNVRIVNLTMRMKTMESEICIGHECPICNKLREVSDDHHRDQ